MGLIVLDTRSDERGHLTIWDREVPFEPKRVFWIYGVPEDCTRANHGHRECEQAIIAVSGSFMVNDLELSQPGVCLYVPTGTIITLHHFSFDAVCLVLCSEHYNASEVFRPETE